MKSQQRPTKPAPAAPSAPADEAHAAPAPGAGNAARAEDLQGRLGRVAATASATLPARERLERSFGVDLGGVRVAFGGDEVRSLLAEKGAQALAVGQTILFAQANPSPELVAHEVTHVLQQRPKTPAEPEGDTPARAPGSAEAEADLAAQAVSAGARFEVQGNAPVGPQFKKSGGGTSGKVSLTLAGASVTPPAFPGGLPAVHDWLMANQAALQSYKGKLKVRFSGTVQQDEQVIWAYWHPDQELVLEGADGAVVSGFTETGGKEYASPGYFLAYRPIIPQAMSAENPASANLDMHGLTVKGFASGGIEISPRSGELPTSAEYADPDYDAEAGHGEGGLTAFLSGASIKDNTFEQMGTKYMKKGTERYDPTDPEAYKYAGFGGIVARGLNYSTIAGNDFSDLENRDSKKKGADGGDVNWTGLMHGVYLRDHSSNNSIRKNDFEGISGAPVKFTNGANYNKVRDNTADDAGKDAFVLDHSAASNPGGAAEADSLGYSNSKIDKAADGKKYIAGNDVGSAWSGYGKTRKMKSFREKRVGG